MPWTYTEWDGAAEVALDATVWNGATEDAIDIDATTIWGESTPGAPQFPGDPGANKMYMGWYTEGSYTEAQAEAVLMKTIVPPGGAANAARAPSIFRRFYDVGNEVYGTHHSSASSDTEARRAIRDGQVHFATWNLYNGTGGLGYVNFLAGGKDTWINTLANKLNDIRDRYDGVVWGTLTNEPDVPGEGVYNDSVGLENLRKCARKLRADLLAKGVTNFAMCTPTLTQQCYYDADNRGQRVKTDGVGTTNRWDGWWEYHPDWKGTRSASWNRAACIADPTKAWDPDPADFYSGVEDNGYGLGASVDIMACNSYCFHGLNGADTYDPANGVWTWSSAPSGPFNDDNVYQAHTLLSRKEPSNDEHTWKMHQALQNLYGTGNYRVAIGELGFPIYEQEGLGNTYPTATANLWAGPHYDELLEAGVVGACHWKQVHSATTAQLQTSGMAIGGRATSDYVNDIPSAANPNKGGDDDPRNTPDGHDCRRKGVAKMMDRPETVGPRTVGPP